MYTMTPYKQQIMDALADGPVVDPSGLAATTLRARIGYRNSANAFAGILLDMEKRGLIIRETVGRRTYRIALVERTGGEVEQLRARVAFLERMVDELLSKLGRAA